ncbi:MAG: ABC transporter ATP-binding protein [Ilumatobacteraceae bacterium]|nr:ABC transporter ATP-binding protein [Ilumatobacteraceae bacterium]
MWGGGAVSAEDRVSRDEARNLMRRTLAMAAPFRKTMLAALACVIAVTLCTLAGPVLVRHGIDAGIRAKNTRSLNISVVAYIAVTCIAYCFGRAQYIFINRAGENLLRILRLRVFSQMQKQSMAFYDREKAGVLVARMTADIESMSELVQWGLLQFISAGFLLFLAVILLFTLSWQLTIVALLVMPVIFIASIKFQRDSNKAYLDVRERVGANLSALQEGIAGVRVIQAYAREEEQVRRFRASNDALYKSHMHSVKVSMWYFGLVEFCGIFASALIVGMGGWLVHRGSVSVGTVVAFVLLLANLFDPVQQLSQLYNTMQSAGAALKKLYGIMDAVPEVDEAIGAVDLPEHGDLVVSGATFTYATGVQHALHNVSISVPNGKRLALVGPTGAGKSTLAKLMARLYDPNEGSISYGGVNLRDATMQSLRERIVVVPQEGFLFNGTIRENLRIAKSDATDAEIDNALHALGVFERFIAFPQGLDTEVHERGSRLSAGERQLVSLARAALVDPAVLVLDEATSNLDPGTEKDVEAALEALMHGRSVVVVAHRLTTVQRADAIGVVDHAELVEWGTHSELVQQNGKYAALVNAWNASQPTR